MAGELRNFDPDQVTVTWVLPTGAIDLTEGLIDGAGAIAETKNAAAWSLRSDRQSNAVRNKMRNKTGTLALTYVAEAEIQSVLSGLAITDNETGAVVGPVVVRDLNGDTIMTYAGAFILDDPTVSFGDTAADRVYTFGYAQRVPFVGGSEAQ